MKFNNKLRTNEAKIFVHIQNQKITGFHKIIKKQSSLPIQQQTPKNGG